IEVQTIVELFTGSRQNSIGYFHQDASEENFKTNVGKYRYVHISTHGFMNEEKPELSARALSQPRDSSYSDDGFLYSSEVYNLDLNADLVVLSSCESGMGKLARGEGLMALTRGFLYAGANNVVVSLWKVFDASTGQLMVAFYRGVVSGKSYSAALREAKLKMIEDEFTAFPVLWSSFILIGK
ncbi:MAG: CHAT domain-containing protein, partial [bacterium]